MGLFDALSGRIKHFNTILVPVHNSIGTKVKELPEGFDKLFFALSLDLIASKIIDCFFRPDGNSIIDTIKEYNRNDAQKLYTILMIWSFYDFINLFKNINKQSSKDKLQNILGLNIDEFDYYYSQLEHKFEHPMRLDKMWKEITNIVHTLPATQENYLVFHQNFSRINWEAFQELRKISDR